MAFENSSSLNCRAELGLKVSKEFLCSNVILLDSALLSE